MSLTCKRGLALFIFVFVGLALINPPLYAQSPLDLLLGQSGEAPKEEENKEADVVDVKVLNEEALSSWRESALKSWSSFFEKDEFLVGFHTFEVIGDDLLSVGESIRYMWRAARHKPEVMVQDLLPSVLFMLSLLVFVILGDRQAQIWARKARDDLETRLANRPGLKSSAWIVLHFATLLIIPVLLQILAAFGLELFYGAHKELTRLLGSCVFLVLLNRLGLAIILMAFHKPLTFLDDPSWSQLERLLVWTLRLVVVCLIALLIIEVTSYRADVGGLVRLMLQVVLIAAFFSLLLLKGEVMALLPERENDPNSVNEWLRRFLDSYYRTFIGLSVVLIVLWAVGFTRAATFLLVRGYMSLALIVMVGVIQRRIDAWVRRRQIQARTPERRAQALAMGRVLNTLLFLGCAALMLVLLEANETALRVIDAPLLSIGSAQISLFRLGKALLLMATFVVMSRLLRSVLNNRIYPRFGIDIGVAYAVNTVLHYSLVVLGLVAGLTALEIPGSSLLFVASALGVGIGFGLQDIAKNLISGFILLLGRAVKKGDTVKVGEHYGVIEAVGARSVTLMTPDYIEIVIPSSELVSQPIVNYSYSSPRIRVRVPVGVHYNSNVRHVEQALLNAALRHEEVRHEPPPRVWFVGFGDNSINFELLVWIDVRRISIPKLHGEMNFHIWDVLKEQQIEIPYPQRDLHLKPGPELEALIRAIRQEPGPDPKPAPAKPQLAVMPSYLDSRERKVNVFDESTHRRVIHSLRDLGSGARRERELRTVAERFFTGRLGSLETQAEDVRDALAAHPLHGQDTTIDKLLLG